MVSGHDVVGDLGRYERRHDLEFGHCDPELSHARADMIDGVTVC